MSKLLRSFLSYARGETGTKFSPWAIMYPLQYLTRAWMWLRIGLYSRGIFSVTDPDLPVISIGNNSLGGTNKTPMTELVVRQFQKAGIRAGLVSRGYRTMKHGPIWVGQDEDSLRREISGDEPLMLARRLPDVKIVVSRDRIAGVRLLSELGAQVAVTDDTFQHRRMARDVDIVLIDSTCPFGNGNVIPAGLMRESMSSFGRADIVVLTKANQVSSCDVERIRHSLEPFVDERKIFTAGITLDSWMVIHRGHTRIIPGGESPSGKFIAFSAIGNPEGFYKFLESHNVEAVAQRSYRDHHIFNAENMSKLTLLAKEEHADGFICTEKDLVNIAEDIIEPEFPLYVPRISITIDDEMRFCGVILEHLRPHLMVASNGYGEDAIGVVLAEKLRRRFRAACVDAFAFVGSGTSYKNAGINVVSPPSTMPSGGIIKYSVFDLYRDVRHGLGGAMRRQLQALRLVSGRYRTPVCVGDTYLLMNLLWGLGMKPLLVATAKTVYLHKHWSIERRLMRHRSRFVWTRDEATAHELTSSGVNAAFVGNPVMDLIDDNGDIPDMWKGSGERVLLLPGSRPRAYDDVNLVLSAAARLAAKVDCSFVMVPAPTIDIAKLVNSTEGWRVSDNHDGITCGGVYVKIYNGPVADVARSAALLIGLGGTANQLCAGLGVPVLSILETGKLRQKKLLREAEELVEANPSVLARAAARILGSPEERRRMSEAGKKLLGGTGALGKITEYCANELGWDNRCKVYEQYEKYLREREERGDADERS